jgi:signal peptidase I
MARATKQRRPRGILGGVVELIVTIGVAIGLALLIQAFIVKPYRIPSISMVPTLVVGQRILVNRLETHPKIGDVVVFRPPAGATANTEGVCGDPNQGLDKPQVCDRPTAQESSQTFVKRVVAVGGDTLYIKHGTVYVNGKPEHTKNEQPCGGGPTCNFPEPVKIPAGDYFMMGDNREYSDDSRYWGPVPQKWIIGVAFFTYWPPGRIGTL